MHLPDRGVKSMGEENLGSQRGPTQGVALLFLTVAGNGLSLIDQFSYLIFCALCRESLTISEADTALAKPLLAMGDRFARSLPTSARRHCVTLAEASAPRSHREIRFSSLIRVGNTDS
jgi:hypothetical protein